VEAAAAGIVDIVNENMFGALRLVSVQQGFDPRDFALVAFGGAGPLHANALGKLTGAWPVIIPPSPGVLCAYGDATTMVRDEAARTSIRRFGALSDGELRELLGELAEAAAATVEEQGVPRAQQAATYHVDLRYHGQGFEITVPVDINSFGGPAGDNTEDRAGLDSLAAAFDTEHSRLFSFLLEGNEHELVSARATVTGPRPDLAAIHLPEGGADPSAALLRTSRIWVGGAHADAAVYERTALRAGNVIAGPAVITEMDSTTLVLPGHAATVHPSGSLLIRPVEGLTMGTIEEGDVLLTSDPYACDAAISHANDWLVDGAQGRLPGPGSRSSTAGRPRPRAARLPRR
jgi:N-methylhydantoinase A